MSLCLPLLAESVTEIIKHSTSDEFKKKSINEVLQIDKIEHVQDTVLNKLNKIAQTSLNFKHDATKLPEVMRDIIKLFILL